MGSAADLGAEKRSEVVVKEGSGSIGAGGCGRGGAGGRGAMADLEETSSALAVAAVAKVDVLKQDLTGVPAVPVHEATDSKVNPVHVSLEEVIHPLYLCILFLFDYLLSGVVLCVRIW